MSSCSACFCIICSDMYKSTDEILVTIGCGHAFHKSCFENWQTRSVTCPECRWQSPLTQRLFMQFEENEELIEKFLSKVNSLQSQLEESKLKLTYKINNLQSQLDESEKNFALALNSLTEKDEELLKLKNELEFKEAQNESYKQEIKKRKVAKDDYTDAFGDNKTYEIIEFSFDSTEDAQNYVKKIVNLINTTNQKVQLITKEQPNTAVVFAKSIFASRFSIKTSEKDVKAYIFKKLGIKDGMEILKLPSPNGRLFSSFKITVPEPIYNNIVQKNFWPKNIYVTDFMDPCGLL